MVRSIREQASFEAVAALCVGLVLCAVAPPAQGAPARAKATPLVVPFVALDGASEPFAVLVSDEAAAELRARGGVKLAEAPASGNETGGAAKAQLDVDAAQAQVRDALGRASTLARKGRHAEAAQVLERAVALLSARPLALDAEGGKLLAEATLRLAVARERAGDDDGGEAALDALVRIDPERRLPAAEFPPAFLRAHEAVRRSVLGGQRGAIRVHAPDGVADAQVLLDGRALHAAPVLLARVLPGAHAVRVERGGQAWAERVICVPDTAPAPEPAPTASADEPVRRVAIPGAAAAPHAPAPPAPAAPPAAVAPAAAPAAVPAEDGLVAARKPGTSAAAEPSRDLVIPREASRDDEAVAAERPRAAPPAAVQLQAVEANELKAVREPSAARQSHTVLWIIAGVVVAGGLAAGGLLLYENGRTPTTATISVGWTH